MITGAFSLTRQAIQLGLLPRFGITHTSKSVSGQIYMPRVNWILLVAVMLVVLLFKTSSNLAAAYGVAVTAQMIIASLMAFFRHMADVGMEVSGKSRLLIVPLLLVEQAFFAANMLKVFEGAWFPLLMAGCVALVIVTWVRGSRLLAKQNRKNEADLDWILRKLEAKPPHRVPGTAVFFTADPNAAPTALMHNFKHNRVLHERNIILTIKTEDTPRVPRYERVTVDRVTDTFIRVIARYGFMETPSVPKILELCRRKDLNVDTKRHLLLPVAPQSQADAQVRDACLAGPPVRRARAKRPGRNDLPRPKGVCGTLRLPGNGMRWCGNRFRRAPVWSDRVVEVGTQVAI